MKHTTMMTVFAAVATSATLAAFAAKPYDAEIEYLDANATSGEKAYINTGIIYNDVIGSHVRFSPNVTSGDSVLFGVGSRNDRSMLGNGTKSSSILLNQRCKLCPA